MVSIHILSVVVGVLVLRFRARNIVRLRLLLSHDNEVVLFGKLKFTFTSMLLTLRWLRVILRVAVLFEMLRLLLVVRLLVVVLLLLLRRLLMIDVVLLGLVEIVLLLLISICVIRINIMLLTAVVMSILLKYILMLQLAHILLLLEVCSRSSCVRELKKRFLLMFVAVVVLLVCLLLLWRLLLTLEVAGGSCLLKVRSRRLYLLLLRTIGCFSELSWRLPLELVRGGCLVITIVRLLDRLLAALQLHTMGSMCLLLLTLIGASLIRIVERLSSTILRLLVVNGVHSHLLMF